jgi:hypothetical protein
MEYLVVAVNRTRVRSSDIDNEALGSVFAWSAYRRRWLENEAAIFGSEAV